MRANVPVGVRLVSRLVTNRGGKDGEVMCLEPGLACSGVMLTEWIIGCHGEGPFLARFWGSMLLYQQRPLSGGSLALISGSKKGFGGAGMWAESSPRLSCV